MHFTGYVLRHGGPPHFLWGKKLHVYTVPLEHKVDYEVKQTKTDQGDHHDDSDAMKQRLLKIGKKS